MRPQTLDDIPDILMNEASMEEVEWHWLQLQAIDSVIDGYVHEEFGPVTEYRIMYPQNWPIANYPEHAFRYTSGSKLDESAEIVRVLILFMLVNQPCNLMLPCTMSVSPEQAAQYLRARLETLPPPPPPEPAD